MVYLVFIAMFLFGSVIGWLVVYFVRRYKEYGPKVLWDTALLFLGGVGIDSLLLFMDKRLSLVALMAYIIGVAASFFAHWTYQFMVAKSIAPKFMDARSKYDLFAGCNLSEDYKDRTLLEYNLECVSQGFVQLNKGLISENEFTVLLKESGLTKQIFEELTSGVLCDMFLSPDLAAYIKAKGLLDEC